VLSSLDRCCDCGFVAIRPEDGARRERHRHVAVVLHIALVNADLHFAEQPPAALGEFALPLLNERTHVGLEMVLAARSGAVANPPAGPSFAHAPILPHSAPAAPRAWREETLNGGGEVGLTSPAVFGFLRIATNPRVLTNPMPVATATGHVRRWLDQPNVRLLVPGSRHLDLAFEMLADIGTAGNLTTDVQLAAFALEQEAELSSNDSGFGRFKDLRWVNPLD
jgi:uncharacterized protein